jgi:hypothetical protein
MDRHLEVFFLEWGKPTQYIAADDASLEQLAPTVPPKLIEFWKTIGFSVFKDGLLTVVNPLDWQDTVDEWIVGTELETLDNFIPLMKGAFGDFKLFGTRKGYKNQLDTMTSQFIGRRELPKYDLDFLIQTFFAIESPSDWDLDEKSLNFTKALKKLGSLQPNEMYGFVPMLPLGGTRDLKHLQKVDAHAHLSILRQTIDEVRGVMEYTDIYK